MAVIDLETFQIAFSETIDSSAIDGFTDFIGIFEEKGAKFSGDSTTHGRMQEPVL
jgi:hypothetical protein